MPSLTIAEPVIAEGLAGERLTYRGSELIFKSPAPGSGQAWTVVDYTLQANQFGPPLHYHRTLIESFYVLSGRLWMRIGDREVNGGPGSFVLVTPGTLHSFANRSSEPVRFLAHASSPRHKTFLCELIKLAEGEAVWPPRDVGRYLKLGERYDTFYV